MLHNNFPDRTSIHWIPEGPERGDRLDAKLFRTWNLMERRNVFQSGGALSATLCVCMRLTLKGCSREHPRSLRDFYDTARKLDA